MMISALVLLAVTQRNPLPVGPVYLPPATYVIVADRTDLLTISQVLSVFGRHSVKCRVAFQALDLGIEVDQSMAFVKSVLRNEVPCDKFCCAADDEPMPAAPHPKWTIASYNRKTKTYSAPAMVLKWLDKTKPVIKAGSPLRYSEIRFLEDQVWSVGYRVKAGDDLTNFVSDSINSKGVFASDFVHPKFHLANKP